MARRLHRASAQNMPSLPSISGSCIQKYTQFPCQSRSLEHTSQRSRRQGDRQKLWNTRRSALVRFRKIVCASGQANETTGDCCGKTAIRKREGSPAGLLKRLFRAAKKEFQAPQKGFVSSKKTRAFFRISGLYSSTDCADASTRPRVAGGFRHSTPARLPGVRPVRNCLQLLLRHYSPRSGRRLTSGALRFFPCKNLLHKNYRRIVSPAHGPCIRGAQARGVNHALPWHGALPATVRTFP